METKQHNAEMKTNQMFCQEKEIIFKQFPAPCLPVLSPHPCLLCLCHLKKPACCFHSLFRIVLLSSGYLFLIKQVSSSVFGRVAIEQLYLTAVPTFHS